MQSLRVLLLRVVLVIPVLHRMVSRRFLLLTALDGAALAPAVPIRYAPHEDYLIALGAESDTWWKDVPAEGSVPAAVRFKGERIETTASLAHGEALDEAVLRYLQKYPGEWRALGVDPGAGPEDVEAAARAAAVIILRPH